MSSYYKPCKELDRCRELNQYWNVNPIKWYEGYLQIAEETHYPLAECQLGYCYLEGIGTNKDFDKSLYWTELAAEHGDRDGQYNLAIFYEEGKVLGKTIEDAKYWYKKAALQDHDLAINKLKELNAKLD